MDGSVDRRVTIKEAAVTLGIIPVAVRKRLVRGKLPGHKDDSGQWFVHLSPDVLASERDKPPGNGQVDTGTAQVIARLEDEVTYLRVELRREREERAEADRRRDILFSQFGDQLKALAQTTTAEVAAQKGPLKFPGFSSPPCCGAVPCQVPAKASAP